MYIPYEPNHVRDYIGLNKEFDVVAKEINKLKEQIAELQTQITVLKQKECKCK